MNKDNKNPVTKNNTDASAIRRKFNGVVVSDKMDQTIVVNVQRMKLHPKYLKRYRVDRHYYVHDPANSFKVGDKVNFEECRPISKKKRWRVTGDNSK
ncbi:30S ribosomal protein S17 [bacterium]|nr:30S ribosomal protein S17 [bacterium]|tara:strand:+ start:1846 stop:2136 length:291 start_codon:yes stop_codon:yes gene_type:complete